MLKWSHKAMSLQWESDMKKQSLNRGVTHPGPGCRLGCTSETHSQVLLHHWGAFVPQISLCSLLLDQ